MAAAAASATQFATTQGGRSLKPVVVVFNGDFGMSSVPGLEPRKDYYSSPSSQSHSLRHHPHPYHTVFMRFSDAFSPYSSPTHPPPTLQQLHNKRKLMFNTTTTSPSTNSNHSHNYYYGCSATTTSSSSRLFASSSSSSSSSSFNNSEQIINSNASWTSVGKKGNYDFVLGQPTHYDTDELSCFRGLVLDIAYRPVNVVCWKRAICLEFMEKADVLEYYDQTVNSPSGSFYIPAVLRVPQLLQVVKRRIIKSTLSRKNILSRDSFTCQYCSSSQNLTIDHVLPISRGGEWTWENLVTACLSCNSRKGRQTLEEAKMKLIKVPKAPKDYDLIAIPLTKTAIKMLRMRKETPDEWLQYL